MINVSSSIYKFLTDMVYNTANTRDTFRFLDDDESILHFQSKHLMNLQLFATVHSPLGPKFD